MRLEVVTADAAEDSAKRLSLAIGRVLDGANEIVMNLPPAELGRAPPDLSFILVTGRDAAEGQSAYTRLVERVPHAPVIAAGEATAHALVQSLYLRGFADALFLPVSDAELRARIRRATAASSPGGGAADDRPSKAPDSRLEHIVGGSPSFARLKDGLPKLASCDAGVLIVGETGTGKELFAQALHYLSPRASRPWVPINCGAIPVDLVESELFGHARGAYTSAHASRTGLVEEAEGGTLFLDDVDCIPLAAQAKLLRLLQEREYRPVGSTTLKRADIRVIAASNRDLAGEVHGGRFRQDLYFRLNVLSLAVPPLRERREDIPLLALHFTHTFARRTHCAASALAPRAVRRLMQHDWPGNVRELQHVMERAVLMSDGPVLTAEDVDIGHGPPDTPDASTAPFRDAKADVIKRFERDYLEQMLARCNGNITQAAREAGKHRRAFFELVRKYRIEPDAFRAAR